MELKLKRKLVYRGHVYFESVRPSIIFRALKFLKKNNPLYYGIDIKISNIPKCLIQFDETDTFLRGKNILDYVASDELIPIILETGVDSDSSKHSSSDNEMIQGALNTINSDCRLPILLENNRKFRQLVYISQIMKQ